ncbi:hypothetical protein MKD34_13975 (plasmid) [Cetobacterium somerae]|uniref:hypothetical protein n=1 Tax=Cetobacterium somerae TaxID=188913 RepID=UPI001F06BFDF|nr:hypothetical protein [Cetobacterium somerae]UPO99034.1 hypothetical protein MKD34_13975 [Cetobacterium somerae]
MSVLENLRNLPEEIIHENLEKLNIKNTGNFRRDTLNLKNFYFENVETLYNHLPMCTHKYLEIALKDDSEKIFDDEFRDIWSTFEDLGLSDSSISNITEDTISFINRYSEANNLQNYPKETFEKIIEEALEKNNFPSEEDIQKRYFEAIDKEIGTVLFEFLENNAELREKENYILKLINGIIEIHGSLDVDETFKVLKKLEIDLSYDQAKRFIISKVPDTLFDYNDVIIVHDRDFDDYFRGKFVKNTIKDIHPLETYLNTDFRI